MARRRSKEPFTNKVSQGNLGLNLPSNYFDLYETQNQQDEILDSFHALISLSNTRDVNKLNLLNRYREHEWLIVGQLPIETFFFTQKNRSEFIVLQKVTSNEQKETNKRATSKKLSIKHINEVFFTN